MILIFLTPNPKVEHLKIIESGSPKYKGGGNQYISGIDHHWPSSPDFIMVLPCGLSIILFRGTAVKSNHLN